MTTEITFRPGTDGLMAALSVAEQLTAASPAVPSNLKLNSCEFAPIEGGWERPTGVLLYFHLSPENVRAFAERFGAVVGEEPRPGDDTYTYADGVLDGVPFRAWTLLKNETAAQVAA